MRVAGGLGFVVVGTLALACGGDDLKPSSVRPMQSREAVRDSGSDANRAPAIRSLRFEPDRPVSGEPVRAVAEAADPDGDPVRLSYVWSVNGEQVRGDGATLSLARAARGDTIAVRVTPSDGRRDGPAEEAEVVVGNRAPRLRGIKIDPAGRITAGGEISVDPTAEDPDGDAVEYEISWWVNDRRADEEGPVLSTKDLRRGDKVRVRVVASDGREESDPIESPEIEVVNAVPVIVSEPQSAEQGAFRYRVQVEDPDGDRVLRFSLAEAPAGMRVDSVSGVVEWTPAPDQQGTFPVEVVVDDRHGGTASQRFDLTIAAPPAAPAPDADAEAAAEE